MNAKNEMRNHIIKIGILVVAIITLGISVTYAYFSAVKKGTVEFQQKAAEFDVTSSLTNSGAISNTKMSLIDAADVKKSADKVEFTVTNSRTSTVNGRYFIYLTNIEITKNLYHEDFKWELVRVNEIGESNISSGNFSTAIRSSNVNTGEADKVMTTAKDILLNNVALEITPGSTDSLIFRLWLENDPVENQIELTEGSFKGKLKIDATPVKPTT